jgi:hypothetical protein
MYEHGWIAHSKTPVNLVLIFSNTPSIYWYTTIEEKAIGMLLFREYAVNYLRKEDQAFSPSYDLAPPRPLPPPSRRHKGRLRKRDNLQEREWAERKVRVGEEPNPYDNEKVCSSINHSILSAGFS